MNEFMKIAKDLSEENLSTDAGGPFGACIVYDGKIIGLVNNHVLKINVPTAHAEIEAIISHYPKPPPKEFFQFV